MIGVFAGRWDKQHVAGVWELFKEMVGAVLEGELDRKLGYSKL